MECLYSDRENITDPTRK